VSAIRGSRLCGSLGLALALGLVVGVTTTSSFSQQLPATFYTVRDVPLPGDTSRFDYESLDPGAHRLYIAHLGASSMPVYDVAGGTRHARCRRCQRADVRVRRQSERSAPAGINQILKGIRSHLFREPL
jgi:hypothetical protein